MKKQQIRNLNAKEIDKGVKIQGTRFDRKRKLTDDEIKKIQKMYNKGIPISKLIEKFHVSYIGIRYNCDPIWALHFNNTRDGKHYGGNKITVKDRVEYKRNLLLKHKVTYTNA